MWVCICACVCLSPPPRLYIQIYLGLQAGWLTKGASLDSCFAKVQRITAPPADERSSTSSGRGGSSGGEVGKLIRSCHNSLHASTLLLLDAGMFRRNLLVCSMCNPFFEWYHEQNTQLRSSAESLQFYILEASGRFLGSCVDSLRLTLAADKLEAMGFVVKVADTTLQRLSGGLDDPRILEEDEHAQEMMRLWINIVRQRINRMLPLTHGLPGHFAALVSEDLVVRSRALAEARRVGVRLFEVPRSRLATLHSCGA